MHPLLPPALRRLWRDDTTLQLGVDPEHATVISPLGAGESALLALLDGTRDVDAVLQEAAARGLHPWRAHQLLDRLRALGVLDDAGVAPPADGPDTDGARRSARAALVLRHGTPGEGRRRAVHRQTSWVEVLGGGPLGLTVVELLLAAGVGAVSVADPTLVRVDDTGPGAFAAAEIGLPRDAAIRRRHGGCPPGSGAPDLVLLAAVALDPAPAGPHLVVDADGATATVGPLVIPGATACLGCVEQHRADRDPAWPALAAQLAWPQAAGGGDPVLVLAAAALAVAQTTAFLDGDPVAAVDGVLELRLGRWQPRRRSYPAHPGCCADDQRLPPGVPGHAGR